MAGMEYQHPMQLMELLGLRGWENAQPRVYWGLRRPDGLPIDWLSPNAGLGGGAGSWGGGYQGGFGNITGGGGGFNSAAVFSAPLSAGGGAARAFGAPDVGGAGAAEPGSFSGAGVGLNAQSANLGDWLGSFTTPVTAWGSLLGQAAYNGIMGRPNQPITNLSLQSLLFGGDGNTGTPGFDGPGGRATGAPDTFGGVSEYDMGFASGGYQGGGGIDTDPGGTDAAAGRGSEW